MKNIGTKYGIISGTVMFLFMNFIACGTQLYQVSVEDDLDNASLPEEASDPQSDQYGIHSARGWENLPVPFRFGSSFTDAQKQALVSAMQTWEKVIGKQLFQLVGTHEGVTGDTFPDLYSSLEDQINGHYIDRNWSKTNKPTLVLATTIWDNFSSGEIVSADIRFNEEHYIIGDSLHLTATDTKEVVDMESLALHELGHLLGLAHVDNDVDALSIMNPHLFIGEGLTSRKISRGDVLRMQRIYGCEGDACDVDEVVQSIELAKSE